MSMFYKKNQPLGTLSSGGHKILNKLKQALTQRTKLMFGGGLKATDNSQDGITLVDDSADEIEFSDWIAKTEEEKEEYAEEHAKFDIINAPGVDELVELKLLTKLWENPAPTASFAAQNITLASDDYDGLIIISYSSSSLCMKNSVQGGSLSRSEAYNSRMIIDTRGYTFNGATVSFKSCYRIQQTQASSSVTVQENNVYQVPIAIYGFKANIKSIISAIASDVSTSASKCMLADGETSVAEALTRSIINDTFVSGNTTSEYTWVAVDDAIVRVTGLHSQVLINNVIVYTSGNTFNGYFSFPVRKGDTVLVKGSSSYATYYAMFKLSII